MKRSILALGLLLFFSVSGWAGSSTPKGFLYKPDLGARGNAEKNLYDAGLDRVDARLGKEIWLGDPGGSPGYNTLAHALTTIGSNQTILRLPAGTITIADNTAIPANVTLKPERGAILSIAANKTMTINGSLDAGLHQIFACTGTGKVVFGAGAVEKVYPHWWYDGGGDWGPAFNAAQTAYNYIKIPSGSYKQNTQVEVVLSNRTFDFDRQALVDLTTLANGTPTNNVSNTVPVLAGFKVSSANVVFKGGRFTGVTGYGGSIHNVGILLANGANYFTSESQYFTGFYTGIRPGGNITDLTIKDPEFSYMAHGCYVGYEEGVAGGVQQVTRAKFINWNSHHHGSDGIKLGCFSDQVEIIGGHYYNNTRDGLDLFVSGQAVSIIGVHATNNTLNGIDAKWNSAYTGTGAGKGGYNRRVIINGCYLGNNGAEGVKVGGNTPDYRAEGFTVTNNVAVGNGSGSYHAFLFTCTKSIISNNIAEANYQAGFVFSSCSDLTITGNIAIGNYIASTGEGFAFKNVGGAFSKNTRLTVIGNRAYGSSSQTTGFSVDNAYIENSIVIGNGAYNHSTNFGVTSGMTGMIIKDNDGFVGRNSGKTGAIASGTDVVHGLGLAPAVVNVTPAETGPTDVFPNTIGGTNFKINFGGGGTKTFYWEAISEYK